MESYWYFNLASSLGSPGKLKTLIFEGGVLFASWSLYAFEWSIGVKGHYRGEL